MSTVLQQPFVEQFREPGTPYLSPALVGDFLGFQVQEGRVEAFIAYLESLAGGAAG